MNDERLVARLVDSYARTGDGAPLRLREAVLRLPDLSDGTIVERRPGSVSGTSGRTRARLMIAFATAAVVVVALVGIKLPALGLAEASSVAVSPRPSPTPAAQASPSPLAAATVSPRSVGDGKLGIDAGPYHLLWPLDPWGASISVTMPEGWWRAGDSTASDYTGIHTGGGRVYQPSLGLAAHSVSGVVASVCASQESSDEVGPIVDRVGPGVDDLTRAILNVVGTHWSSPEDVTIGGYPGKRLMTTFSSAVCPGPARRWIWADGTSAFYVEDGVTSTIYVVDVNGDRLVLTSDDRDAAPDDVAQLHAILASIRIQKEPAAGAATPTPTRAPDGSFPMGVGPDADLRIGRHTAVVDGIRFSFDVPTSRWEPRQFYISKSFAGPQDADAILRWTAFPDSHHVDPCPDLLNPPGPSAAGLAAVVATAPGIELVSGPSDVTVGGRPAKQIVLTVVDAACQPGFFYTYDPARGGAFWLDTYPGDTITVWIVEVDGRLLFIEGETRDPGPALEQIQQIVDSIRFG